MMTFKSRGPANQAFQYMENFDESMLVEDFGRNGRRSKMKCVLPLNHISKCVINHFRGQSWLRVNEDDIRRDLLAIGVQHKAQSPLRNHSVSLT